MAFKIEEGNFYHAMYFVSMPVSKAFPKGGNVTAMLWRPVGQEEWNWTYRFRYYVTEGAWDGKDRFSWYEGRIKIAPDKLPTAGREMMECFATASLLAFGVAEEIEEMKIGGGPDHWLAAVQRDKPEWLHIQCERVE